MLSILFNHKKSGFPYISAIFGLCCLLVSLPTLLFPELYQLFGGFKPLLYPWQRVTMSFAHGFPGFPLLVHLAANGALFWFCGPFCEKILGTARYAVLVITAMVGFALTHRLFWVDGHGASGVIWALAPVVFIALRTGRKTAPESGKDPVMQQGRIILVIMWAVVTFFMTLIPYFQGWQGNPLWALMLGNTFHITATIVGFTFALSWRKHIEERLQAISIDQASFELTKSDKAAIWLALPAPLFILLILVLVIAGNFTYF